MAISANTTTPLRFLRRFSGNMEPPVYEFPVLQTSQAWRPGDLAVIAATTDGKVTIGTTALAVAATLAGVGVVGVFKGASSSAPIFPTSAGVQGVYTSPAAVTTDDPIPENEKISCILTLPDCIFVAHQVNNATDITAPDRQYATTTGGVLAVMELVVQAPTGETSRVMVDSSAQTAQMAFVLAYAYPQPIPQTRSASSGADPFRVRMSTAGTSNPAVEFQFMRTLWNPVI